MKLRKNEPRKIGSITIDSEGDKKLKELDKKKIEALKKMEKKFDQQHKELLETYGKTPQSRLNFWKQKKATDPDSPKFWTLVNVEALKEFIKYGANKVLDQIRVRTAANIIAREEIERIKKEKKGLDLKTIAFSFILLALAAAIAIVLISNFFNYKDAQESNVRLMTEKGSLAGQLAMCQVELRHYNPSLVPPEIAMDQPAGNNTLTG